MAKIELIVDGLKHSGWESIQVTRSIESLCGSFSVQAHDRWSGEGERVAIAEESAIRIEIDGETVLAGYVDARNAAFDESNTSLTLTGRDAAAALLDCSVLPPWSFARIGLLELAEKLLAQHGLAVSKIGSFALPPPSKVVINPGESAWQVLERIAQIAGVLFVSDGAGGLDIVQSGTSRAEALVQGANVLSGSVVYNAADRFRQYVCYGSASGTDKKNAGSLRSKGVAIDEGVARTSRSKIIRARKGADAADTKRRADWEARLRAARSESATFKVNGWKQSTGALWPVNALTYVDAPRFGMKGEMLISQVTYSMGTDGTNTQIKVVRPDAFTPDPAATVKHPRAWKQETGR